MYYKDIREYILNNTTILEIIDFKGIIVFKDAGVDSIILLLKKEKKEEYIIKYINNIKEFENQIYDINYFKNSQIKEKKIYRYNFLKMKN